MKNVKIKKLENRIRFGGFTSGAELRRAVRMLAAIKAEIAKREARKETA
jgi:hypothetical protein